MIWTCTVCGERGIDGHLEAVLIRHQRKSPNCPVNERTFVTMDGVYAELSEQSAEVIKLIGETK